jgi:hypothetical protein
MFFQYGTSTMPDAFVLGVHYTTGVLYTDVNDVSTDFNVGGLADNQWHNVVVAYGGSTTTVWIDGVFKA